VRTRDAGVVALCAVLLTPAVAHAQMSPKKTLSLLAGAAMGLAVHESGHVITGALFGAHPGTAPIHYAGIPFFAITHEPVTRKKEFVISSAGFWMQHAGSEWLLSTRPNLRDESAPFLKGVLAFNIATSVMYAGAAFGKLGPPERDPLGMANSLGRTGWPEPAVGALILAPALLDGYRYLKPDQKWAAWASRGVKAAFIALTFAAGRPFP
jgi:hypothetical protein